MRTPLPVRTLPRCGWQRGARWGKGARFLAGSLGVLEGLPSFGVAGTSFLSLFQAHGVCYRGRWADIIVAHLRVTLPQHRVYGLVIVRGPSPTTSPTSQGGPSEKQITSDDRPRPAPCNLVRDPGPLELCPDEQPGLLPAQPAARGHHGRRPRSSATVVHRTSLRFPLSRGTNMFTAAAAAAAGVPSAVLRSSRRPVTVSKLAW